MQKLIPDIVFQDVVSGNELERLTVTDVEELVTQPATENFTDGLGKETYPEQSNRYFKKNGALTLNAV